MKVDLALPRADLHAWHAELARRLAAEGCDVACLVSDGPAPLAGARLLEHAERRFHPAARWSGHARAQEADLPGRARDRRAGATLVDLTGAAVPLPDSLAPAWNGRCGQEGFIAARLSKGAPHVALMRDGAVVAAARPAVVRPDVALAVAEAMIRSFCDLLSRMLGGRPLPAPPAQAAPLPKGAREGSVSFVCDALAQGLARKLERCLARPARWRTGWRRHGGAPILATLQWPETGFEWLPDDGRRYYADPFLFTREGRTFVFVEEFPYATGKGVIAVTELGAGAPATPRVVVERPWHLSYPLVFEEDGEIWMTPESSAGRRIELLRARSFPDEWEVAGVLVEGVPLSDATLFRRGSRWWMTAVETRACTSWDALVLYSAQSRLGPWTRESEEPVLIDAATARPAGHVVQREETLWRPVQDCSAFYGGALGLCRIDAIDRDRFAQTLVARLSPPAGAVGLHTLNADETFEVTDMLEPARLMP